MSDQPEVFNVDVQWEANRFVAPSLVNQAVVTPGPPTQFGGDGLVYLRLGHVSMPPAPPQPDEDGRRTIGVVELGDFVMTVERAKEIRALLATVIDQAEAARGRGAGQ